MSGKSFFVALGSAAVAALVSAAKAVEGFVVTEADKALVFAKQNEPLVTKTLNLISDLESKTLSGADKMNKVLSDIGDEFGEFLAEGGFSGILATGEALLRSFGQSVFADFKADIAKL